MPCGKAWGCIKRAKDCQVSWAMNVAVTVETTWTHQDWQEGVCQWASSQLGQNQQENGVASFPPQTVGLNKTKKGRKHNDLKIDHFVVTGVTNSGAKQEASDLLIPTVVPTAWGYHPHTISGNLARCGWRRLILWDQFTFTNVSESPDASSLFTCKNSFGKWSNNSLHSVKPHSFSSDNATLPHLFNQINCNTQQYSYWQHSS